MDKTVLVCCGTGCLANGSLKVAEAFRTQLEGTAHRVECVVKETGCQGFCENGPMVRILPDDITYYKVKPADAAEIVAQTVEQEQPVTRLLAKNDAGQPVTRREDNPFFAPQVKVALRNVGATTPSSVEDYVSRGGYEALKKALTMTPDEIITEVERSGLPHRAEVAHRRRIRQLPQICGVQRRRGRPRRIHGRLHSGGRPPLGAGGHGHLRPGHRRGGGLPLHPG